ncbi:MucBP domain-containing protein [Erysipelotrichaceae bacterium HCN-30851]
MNMRNRLKNIIAGVAAAFLCMLPIQLDNIHAAEYEIVFKGGAHGTVNGETKVSYRLTTNDRFPNEPDIQVEDGYVFLGWNKELPEPGSMVDGKEVYVAKYGVLVDGITYTVRYVDEEGADIATPRTMIGESGSEITERAKYVSGYEFQQSTQTFTLNRNNQEITFVYTLTNPEEVIRYEEITEEVPVDQVVTVPGTEGTGGGDAGAGADAGTDQETGGETGEDTENVDDQETPQSGGEETVDDNETPLSDGDKDKSNNNYAIIAGVGALVVVALVLLALAKKKKNGKVSEE